MSHPLAYYNEIDPKAAAALRGLIVGGFIPDGDVDERSIADVRADDLTPYTQCHFFAGIGVWAYALRQAGWPNSQRVWTGSCPCQPFSNAGKQKGFADERHLWPIWRSLIQEGNPPIIFGEQVASKAAQVWLDLVSGDLEGKGYSFGAASLCGQAIANPQQRQRIYFVADSRSSGGPRLEPRRNSRTPRQERRCSEANLRAIFTTPFESRDCRPQPLIRRVDDDLTNRVSLLHCYGNAIIADLATEFIVAAVEAINDTRRS